MLRFALCDDQITETTQQVALLEAYCATHEASLEYTVYHSPLELLSAVQRGQRYEAIMLDIVMPGLNGIETARELRQYDTNTKIIFLTSSAEFAVESYTVDAYYYLLKPLERETAFRLLSRVIQDEADRSTESFVLRCVTGIARVEFSQLKYVESLDKLLLLHLADGKTLKSRTSMQEISELLLRHEAFFRPHRSYLVNMAFVQNITHREIELKNGVHIPLPHGKFSQTKQAFLQYAFGKEQNKCRSTIF